MAKDDADPKNLPPINREVATENAKLRERMSEAMMFLRSAQDLLGRGDTAEAARYVQLAINMLH